MKEKPKETPAMREISRDFAKNSIVTQATARLIEQVLTEAAAVQRAAVAAEREACAQLISTWPSSLTTEDVSFQDGVRWACLHLQTAIRARKGE